MEKISFNFKNRTAVITGGAQGFGLDIAKRFLNSGAKVIIWDIDPEMIEKSLKDINNSNLSSNIVDVSNYQEVENSVKEITKNSNIDILINNAGITGPTATLWEYDIKMWKKVVDINLMGTFNCCRAIEIEGPIATKISFLDDPLILKFLIALEIIFFSKPLLPQ